eukprot:5085877-Prymnesium_polylepis.1
MSPHEVMSLPPLTPAAFAVHPGSLRAAASSSICAHRRPRAQTLEAQDRVARTERVLPYQVRCVRAGRAWAAGGEEPQREIMSCPRTCMRMTLRFSLSTSASAFRCAATSDLAASAAAARSFACSSSLASALCTPSDGVSSARTRNSPSSTKPAPRSRARTPLVARSWTDEEAARAHSERSNAKGNRRSECGLRLRGRS